MDSEQRLAKKIAVPVKIEKIKIGKYDINYVTAGSGKPLLLIHGGNIGWGQWYPNIAEFAKHFRVYAIDLVGAGRSSKVDFSKLDLQRDLVDVVSEFIEKKRLGNFSVVGSSIGGWIALELTLTKSNVEKLVVVDSIGFADSIRFADKILSITPFAKLLAKTVLTPKRNNKNIEKFLRDVFYKKDLEIWEEFIDYFYDTMKTSHNLLFISSLSSFFGVRSEFRMKDKLPKIGCGTLVIWGEKDKFMSPAKIYNNFKLIPNVSVEIIKNAGHIPSIEKSAEFNKLVLKFLRS